MVCFKMFSCVPSCVPQCSQVCRLVGGGWVIRKRFGPRAASTLQRTLHSTPSLSILCCNVLQGDALHLCKAVHCIVQWKCCSVQGCALRNNLFRCWLNCSPTRQVKGEGGPSTSCTLCAHPTSSNLLHSCSALSFPVLCT